jgi:hypothetical protein
VQVVSEEQQKSDGKLSPHCERPDMPPQTGSARWKTLNACDVGMVVEMRHKTDNRESFGETVERSMMARTTRFGRVIEKYLSKRLYKEIECFFLDEIRKHLYRAMIEETRGFGNK